MPNHTDFPSNVISLRKGIEQRYRELARLASDRLIRRDLVKRANAVRPVTWV